MIDYTGSKSIPKILVKLPNISRYEIYRGKYRPIIPYDSTEISLPLLFSIKPVKTGIYEVWFFHRDVSMPVLYPSESKSPDFYYKLIVMKRKHIFEKLYLSNERILPEFEFDPLNEVYKYASPIIVAEYTNSLYIVNVIQRYNYPVVFHKYDIIKKKVTGIIEVTADKVIEWSLE